MTWTRTTRQKTKSRKPCSQIKPARWKGKTGQTTPRNNLKDMFCILFEWFWNTLDYLGNFYFVTATHFGIILGTLDSVKKFDYNKQIHSSHEHLSWFTVPFIKLKRKARLVFLGLDGAGKTTLMGRLKYDRLIQAVPTGQPSELSTTIFFFQNLSIQIGNVFWHYTCMISF